MAKKKNDFTIKSQDELRGITLQNAIISGGLASTFVAYFGLNTAAYLGRNPRASIMDFGDILGAIKENPFGMFPIDYSPGLPLFLTGMTAAGFFLMYQYDKIRTHNNLDTLKGSTEWANIKEIRAKYADFTGAKNDDYVHAYSNAILSNKMYMSFNTRKTFQTLNTLILGASGTGKSRYFLKPNLLQLNASFVITDPSGGIMNECGEMLRRFGYNVRVFDVATMMNCNTYNPLKYCYQESDIKKIVQAFIKNTDSSGGKGGGNKDPFWDDSMNAFLCACISLLCTTPQECITPDGRKIPAHNLPYGRIPEITGGTVYKECFATLAEITRMANSKWTKDCGIELYTMKSTGDTAKLGDGKNNGANASKLAAIFENLRMWEADRQGCSPDEIVKPYTLREWENFRIAPEKTSTTILMTTAVRLDPFNIEQVKDLTSSDNICLDTFSEQKDALFLIIPAEDKTYNFLISFIYTQLFDILYKKGAKMRGRKRVTLPNGDFVKLFSKEESTPDSSGKCEADRLIELMKNAKVSEEIPAHPDKDCHLTGSVAGKGKGKKGLAKKVPFFDGWYEILDSEGNYICRRPTKELAEEYVKQLKDLKVDTMKGSEALPNHVRFLMDEFPNIGEVPEFLEKLSTIRKYEISVTVICQTITQLKGMYPDNYEVIDANCATTIFLGGTENSNNEYISKKMGTATVKSSSNSVDNKKVSQSLQTDQRELMKPEELGRMPKSKQIVIMDAEQPIYDDKFDYPNHKNYKYTNDYASDIGLRDAVLFDRSGFKPPEDKGVTAKAETVTAIPEIFPLTEENFKSIFRAPTFDIAEEMLEEYADAIEMGGVEDMDGLDAWAESQFAMRDEEEEMKAIARREMAMSPFGNNPNIPVQPMQAPIFNNNNPNQPNFAGASNAVNIG